MASLDKLSCKIADSFVMRVFIFLFVLCLSAVAFCQSSGKDMHLKSLRSVERADPTQAMNILKSLSNVKSFDTMEELKLVQLLNYDFEGASKSQVSTIRKTVADLLLRVPTLSKETVEALTIRVIQYEIVNNGSRQILVQKPAVSELVITILSKQQVLPPSTLKKLRQALEYWTTDYWHDHLIEEDVIPLRKSAKYLIEEGYFPEQLTYDTLLQLSRTVDKENLTISNSAKSCNLLFLH